jgi:hypothetical protein
MFQKCPAQGAPAHLPPADFDHGGFWINTEGFPLAGNYTSPALQIPVRDKYDNHPAIADANTSAVEAKFAAKEENTFHIHLPQFLIHFLNGILLAPLQWAMRKGKGCICVD